MAKATAVLTPPVVITQTIASVTLELTEQEAENLHKCIGSSFGEDLYSTYVELSKVLGK